MGSEDYLSLKIKSSGSGRGYSGPILMILVTGGLGYIGSHTCVALAAAGYRLMIVDNLCNAKPSALERIRELAPGAVIEFQCADLRDRAALEAGFAAPP